MTDCPEWTGHIPEQKKQDFLGRLRKCYREVCATATSKLIYTRDLERWHHQLFEDVVPLPYYAGHFRKDDPKRPCLRSQVDIAGISGEDFRAVPERMNEIIDNFLITLTKAEINWSQLSPQQRAKRVAVLLAFLIGEFIRIHPFINGNGRTSRLMWCWGLLRFNVNPQCRIVPRPDAPYGNLMAKAMQGDFRPLALRILRHLALHPPSVR